MQARKQDVRVRDRKSRVRNRPGADPRTPQKRNPATEEQLTPHKVSKPSFSAAASSDESGDPDESEDKVRDESEELEDMLAYKPDFMRYFEFEARDAHVVDEATASDFQEVKLSRRD